MHYYPICFKKNTQKRSSIFRSSRLRLAVCKQEEVFGCFKRKLSPPASRQAARDIMKQARRKWLFCGFCRAKKLEPFMAVFHTSPENGCFRKWWGFPPKSSILIGFSIINHPFWGTPILRNIHISNVLSCYFNFMLGKC